MTVLCFYICIGWTVGRLAYPIMAASTGFQSAVFPAVIDGRTVPGYAALYALAINIVVSALLSVVLNPLATRADETQDDDYHFEASGAR